MLWYKSWIDTRWRFVLGLVLLAASACASVLSYPQVLKMLPLAGTIDIGGVIGERVRENLELVRDYRGYVWSQVIRSNLTQTATLFAVLLGSGSPLAEGSRGAAIFTLSLPASRNEVLGVRASTGLGELLLLALVPSLAIPLLSPVIGQTYGVGSALVHATCLFFATATFFSLAFLLSSAFGDLWRPLLIAVGVAVLVRLAEVVFPGLSRYGIFGLMNGETYFRTGGVPWAGLLVSAALSAAMLYGATLRTARKDF
jgi:ABC-type transport system involved in multi-copper enzyme maturation permease subunit